MVLALPKASSTGLAWITCSSRLPLESCGGGGGGGGEGGEREEGERGEGEHHGDILCHVYSSEGQ